MTKKNIKPQQVAPVERENIATVSRDGKDGNAITPALHIGNGYKTPFAGDDAE